MHADVVIVGGRAAGATLAIRLGQAGLSVVLAERNIMPSLPGASMPIIYASTMALLDEIGAQEAEYARDTPRIRRMVNRTRGFDVSIRLPQVKGRDYAYAIDRERFDGALWAQAAATPGVTALSETSFVGFDRDSNGSICGAILQRAGEKLEVRAPLVVGADGRFSVVARMAGAYERDAHHDNPTSLLYAYWSGVQPLDDEGPAASAYGEGDGIGYLVMDSADGMMAVGIEGRADLLQGDGRRIEETYASLLRRVTSLRDRLDGARPVTSIRGMRRIGNLYRQPGASGWALVGDAFHQKDPIDGQGMYDAVFSAKMLAEAILGWKSGASTWDDALTSYERRVRSETLPMYRATLERVQTSLYSQSPEWLNALAGQTLFRWLIEDAVCQEQLGLMLTREVRPDEVLSVPLVLGAMIKGPLRDLSRRLQTLSQS